VDGSDAGGEEIDEENEEGQEPAEEEAKPGPCFWFCLMKLLPNPELFEELCSCIHINICIFIYIYI